MTYPFGETIVLHARTKSGRDGDGNAVYSDTATTLPNIPVWPRVSTEAVQGQDLTIDGISAWLPAGTNPHAIDYVTRKGLKYEIDGDPGEYQSPFTGSAGVLVNLKRVSG